jgi:hypothetical protein
VLLESTLRAFYEAVDRAADLKAQIMLRLLFYTAVRISCLEVYHRLIHEVEPRYQKAVRGLEI